MGNYLVAITGAINTSIPSFSIFFTISGFILSSVIILSILVIGSTFAKNIFPNLEESTSKYFLLDIDITFDTTSASKVLGEVSPISMSIPETPKNNLSI